MNEIKDNTKKWFEEWILKLNLCPFAHSVYAKKQIRFEIEESENFEKCVQKAVSEITFLEENNDDKIQNYVDTTLLIFPNIFLDCDKNSNSEENILFNDFLDFVAVLDLFLEQNNLEDKFQVVAFHPNYIFEGEDINSKSHFTNRSPYPILHILREESVEKAIENYNQVESIPQKNIEKLEKMKDADFEWLKSFSVKE
ncbi:hypothetical protein Fleli_0464 [Bernardetia litoralis DSM 6794]|uniref:DUF1415 domain-containing protein n=1 Tax=Bernardetia litoralis (strain ATCC 23117 / DSM 6794 / NBRC 15988 / NCIMB 1366 / Fx l1 / Sio-4) TaxID=880071 RepID=I4AG55_BERLS|nr:DUF1415 domain-containing protein [Bernardetia litoralis]AFM02940.1 hypothetical protein Fleli_0464 [Bernardetia litoralis DSM 6794]